MGFISTSLRRATCRVLGHVWHPLTWRTAWGEWAHLWRCNALTWDDHPSWGLVGPLNPYDSPSSQVCVRCGCLHRAPCHGGVVHLNVLGIDVPEHPRPVACAGELTLGAAPSNDPFRGVR